MEKFCRICKESKELEKDFHKKKGSPDGYRHECKECVKDIQKKYKEDPSFKEKRKEYDKQRYDENKVEILDRKKDYYIENRETLLEKKKEYRKKDGVRDRERHYYNDVYSKDPKNKDVIYKYRRENPHMVAWRSILHSTLKRLGTEKQGHTIDLLGYSAEQLKEHIEKLFTPQMTWDNHGEWHIDHIIPVSAFNSDADIKYVCGLSNLQPLWATTREIDGVIYEGNLNKGC